MDIKLFAVEDWMNKYEMSATYNIAETCVDSLTVEELISIDGTNPEDFFRSLASKKLTYGHIEGSPEFRTLVSQLYTTVDPHQVLVMNGGIAANFLVFYSLVKPGDHVISVHPTYQQIYDVPKSFGATVDLLHLKEENGFLPDLDELRSLVRENTKLICINNPNNPSGSLMERDTLEKIVEIARSCGAYLLCDEVYRNLLQDDDLIVPSIADLYEKGISTSSMSKALSLAGLRLGWIAAPKEVIEECIKHRDYTTISVGMLDDLLAVHAMKNYDRILTRNRKIIKDNLAILDEWVANEPAITYVKPRAGTTAMLRYDLPISSVDFCEGLLKETGAFLTPGICFEMEGYLRIGYACETEMLREGLQKLSEYIRSKR
ncbi:aminotransferase [Brevibacillus centrosporus]|uniref:aminotransferase n=1 Tax=Brevibacillus centrosporus TaxID=54910 RepID=UPI000F0A2B15|nr:aminotransferase [Brevibacillus centrosporus]MEC2128250.1 aminotransferase [Brevibacillus centrosporus]RNB73893.1 aminotransferase [Brevibacillus centrosporus]GED30709.1 aminotransferase [Brevibacillus centrosporus]